MRRFKRRTILALPEQGFSLTFANALGISPARMSQWINSEGAPAKAVSKTVQGRGGHWLIRKSEFVAWLIQTGRYKRGRGYDE